MSDQRDTKRIKLSLEPFLSNNVSDILDTGHEILKPEINLSEKLMTTVDRIWFERGEWKDITEKSLLESIQKKDEVDLKDEEGSATTTSDAVTLNKPSQQPQQPQIPEMDIIKLRELVINQFLQTPFFFLPFRHGKSEVDVALDVVNILTASNRSSSGSVKDLVLPAGSLTATYVTKPKPTTKAQLESVQLNLGLKRKKQREAADFLRKSAFALKDLVEKEQVFWDEALDLRRNNWQMQASGNSAGSSFYVQYGFLEVGSQYNEASVGELRRSEDTQRKTANNKESLQLLLPHAIQRKVMVQVKQNDGILGIKEQQKDSTTMESDEEGEHAVQSRLVEACSTVFDAELFANVLAEAQALSSNVRFPMDEIVISIDGQLDMSIKKVTLHDKQSTTTKTTAASTSNGNKQMVSRSIGLAFKLLLLQQQRYHVWRARAKTLSNNYRLRQLLKEQDSATTSNSNATKSSTTVGSSILSNHRAQTMAHDSSQPPSHLPILDPILSFLRFWIQFDKMNHVVQTLLTSFQRIGGCGFFTHVTFFSDRNPWTSSSTAAASSRYEDVYPGFGKVALGLSIHLAKGPSLQFGLDLSGFISVYLPQTTVVLQNVSEFEAFLSREIKIIVLRSVCEVANDIILGHHDDSVSNKQQHYLWQVDQVDESIHGYMYCDQKENHQDKQRASSSWRNV
ncbi:subunit 17 of mediator complex-domain-containing protein [Mycotypha africana]|uniref:subunit 17 of mediator complex-domain-containing protein n=1 Tax=Mycotypha africana TaxID=64632 RepID=UPI002300D525|nr:subunit 17 of mediator complex-domain-containing protein [Mycotypha africana]KAI8984010.1 subunit 17 of mediator complex-domain-containing protein [Mycotypha africana]